MEGIVDERVPGAARLARACLKGADLRMLGGVLASERMILGQQISEKRWEDSSLVKDHLRTLGQLWNNLKSIKFRKGCLHFLTSLDNFWRTLVNDNKN